MKKKVPKISEIIYPPSLGRVRFLMDGIKIKGLL
jgi:hypothetical protein